MQRQPGAIVPGLPFHKNADSVYRGDTMTYQQLVCFIEVKKTLNFTKAAQNLHVTQSALSYSIVSLEKDLGVPLFVRQSGQGIRLTSYGRSLYPMAEATAVAESKADKTTTIPRK